MIIFFPLQFAKANDDATAVNKPKTTLEVMQTLTDTITQEIFLRSQLQQGDSVSVSMPNGGDYWIFFQTFTEILNMKHIHVFVEKDSSIGGTMLFEGHGIDLEVSYHDMFRDGLFGTKKVVRKVTVGCSYQLLRKSTHEVVTGGSLSKSSLDTILVDDVVHVESDGVKSTHAELPSENIIDRFVEPFVIIGATGVAVYLFFHIRS